MVIFKSIQHLRAYLNDRQSAADKVGFVPTMGALHAGHISLIAAAKKESGCVVCSIFVNPTQFNDKNDLEKYPKSAEADIAMLVAAGCDVLFMPDATEIYPADLQIEEYDFDYLDTILEGERRPGHFRGVGQVVARLLDIMQPATLYLGQKDYQQCMVIKMLKQKLQLDALKVTIVPTVREEDGLAMSSRNRRLSDSSRAKAALIYQCLVSIQAKIDIAPFAKVKKECFDILTDKSFEVEYIALADARGLTLLTDYADVPMVALIAAKLGDIRLIDNILLN